jgi:hypothetical protein
MSSQTELSPSSIRGWRDGIPVEDDEARLNKEAEKDDNGCWELNGDDVILAEASRPVCGKGTEKVLV